MGEMQCNRVTLDTQQRESRTFGWDCVCISAALAWQDLKERFDKVNGSKIFFLHRSISTLNQESDFAYATTSFGKSSIFDDSTRGITRVHLYGVPTVKTTTMFSNASRSSDHCQYNGVCDYCKIKGHRHDNCYQLIGFPSDFKFTKKKIPQAAMAINSEVTDHSTSDLGSSATSIALSLPVFITDQYNQILSLISKAHSKDSIVNLAGTLSRCLPATNGSLRWTLDTGATDHILSDFESLLFPVLCATPCYVHLPNGKTYTITHIGSYRLTPDHLITNVLLVPNFSHNLVSVSKLSKELNCSIVFYPDFCLLQDLSNGMIKRIGREFRGLYFFGSAKGVSGLLSSVQCSVFPFSNVVSHDDSMSADQQTTVLHNNTHVWHARLGHASITIMQNLPVFNSCKLDTDTVHNCSICPSAK